LLAGRRAELAPALGAHRDLNAIVDASGDDALGEELERLAAETVKRVLRIRGRDGAESAQADALRRLEALTELKTAWHPIGA
ncbi:MAG: aldehyde dehydrogenase family protein, partial [Solirubrobacteraceae bacterium]